MAVPSSGELELRGDIALEVYGTATGSNISLGTMSNLAGFTEPDSMSEFYGYSSADAPSVTTNAISNVAETSVTLNGNVTSDGGATITERGFYFGTNSASPTNNTKYTVSGTTGTYTNNRTGLNSSTTYYSWAFATNSKGTTYGSRVQATTIAAFNPTFVFMSNGLGMIATFFSGYYGDILHYHQKYYRNPNTNSLVNYDYSVQGEEYNVNQIRIYPDLNYIGAVVCTNAKNMLINTSNVSDANAVQYTMQIAVAAQAPRTFTNRSFYSNFNGTVVNQVINESTTQYHVKSYTNGYFNQAATKDLIVEFNYS